MSRVIRWGVLSTGTIARNFVKTAAAMPEAVCVAAVASRSMDKANAFADEFGIERRYGSYEALAHDPDVDVVYGATPEQTVAVMALMDEVRRQNGLVFPFETA